MFAVDSSQTLAPTYQTARYLIQYEMTIFIVLSVSASSQMIRCSLRTGHDSDLSQPFHFLTHSHSPIRCYMSRVIVKVCLFILDQFNDAVNTSYLYSEEWYNYK
jgi:hypothetical protein